MKPEMEEFINVVSHGASIGLEHRLSPLSELSTLGISSMDTIQLVNEIDKKYGVILEFDDFDKAKTMADLYRILLSKLA